jgi:23S rRNA (cytosine1962-C5)-methyltransferase
MNKNMNTMIKITLKSGKDEAIRRFHPWIFSGAIKKIEGDAEDGVPAEVYSDRNHYLGTGLYQDASIAVRIMTFAPHKPAEFDYTFWHQKLLKAFHLRQVLGLTDNEHTNVYRLVHGEGDQLPGLIIDHYNGNLVIQAHAVGIHNYLPEIAQALQGIYGNRLKSIYNKSRETLPSQFASTINDGFLFGTTASDIVKEYGHDFEIDFIAGQKTGFFIDQRENRLLLSQYARGKRVLNTFCYSGGFSVYALKAGASHVESLDSSKKAIQLTEKNVQINFPECQNHEVITADAVQYIRETATQRDIIILDPPAFAKHSNVRHNAVQGYKRLNTEAIARIAPGGLLFTFSCSQVVSVPLFRSTVIAAAIEAGREVKILHQMAQPPDHPVNAFHPEGEYLKGLVLYVE